MSSLLIIGGSGFIGKSILDSYQNGKLERWGIDEIIVLSRSAENLKKSNPELIKNKVSLINDDITKCTKIPLSDYILHLAASSDASKYKNNPEKEKKNITEGTKNFCKLIKNSGDIKSKILYVSSGAVYGNNKEKKLPFKENDKLISISKIENHKKEYTEAKRDSENQIIYLGKSRENLSIARCFSFIGKYLPIDQHFAIGNFINDALNNEIIKVKTENLVYRSYMDADEMVYWLMRIVTNLRKKTEIYNVGSNIQIEIRELAKLIADITNSKFECKEPNKNNIDFYVPCTDKAKKNLGLEIKNSLEYSVKKTIDQINATTK